MINFYLHYPIEDKILLDFKWKWTLDVLKIHMMNIKFSLNKEHLYVFMHLLLICTIPVRDVQEGLYISRYYLFVMKE